MKSLRKICAILPTKFVVHIDNLRCHGRMLNLKKPKYYYEKIQWIKLYGQVERATIFVDKYLVRNYVKEKIGEEYLPKLYNIYTKVDEIDYDKLPEKFVLKMNNGAGGNIICKDKSSLDKNLVRKKFRKLIKENYYKYTKEPQYKNVNNRIICEEYLENNKGFLLEYKLHCFEGKVKFIEVHTDRFNGNKQNYYYPDWSEAEFRRKKSDNKMDYIEKPKNLEELINLGETLSEGFTYIRVDINATDDKLYFSELTFTPSNGTNGFYPIEKDIEIAKMIDIENYKIRTLDNN